MKLPISGIHVQGGRRPIGDLRELVASIDRVGLLHPVVVTEDHQLVAGAHRLRACEQLGWKSVPVTIMSASKLTSELAGLDENLVRAELTVLQRAEQLARRKQLYEALHPETRRGVAGGRASGGSRRGERTTDTVSLVWQVAQKAGVSSRTIERQVQIATGIPKSLRKALHRTWAADDQKALLQIARLEGAEQGAVVELISAGTGSVRLAKARAIGATLGRVKAPTGRYRAIVVDPPWPYEASDEDYPSSSLSEIAALPVRDLAEDNAVLWLWTTNLMMRHVYPLLDAWGFAEQTILTWVKPKIGKGWYLRNQTEHCVLAIRGRPVLMLAGQSTVLTARSRERGRKPDEFYGLVDSLCPGAKLDMYARQSRPGWTTWGAEATSSRWPRGRLDCSQIEREHGEVGRHDARCAAGERPARRRRLDELRHRSGSSRRETFCTATALTTRDGTVDRSRRRRRLSRSEFGTSPPRKKFHKKDRGPTPSCGREKSGRH